MQHSIRLPIDRLPDRPFRSDLRRSLTAREREIAFLVADGLKNVSIARRLTLSPATVATYVQRIQFRLGVTGRDQIARWVQARAAVGHRDIIPSPPAADTGC
jgi:DNA-binding CsgD family transcriptional regulator